MQLKKALYGLKQAPRAWHACIASYLVSIGFCMADADNSLYVQKNDHGIVTICICVDDLIVGGDHEVDIEHVKTLLKEEFDMKDLGELRISWALKLYALQRAYGCHKDNTHWICYPSMVWLIVSLFLCRWIRI